MEASALAGSSFLTYYLPNPLQFLRHLLVGGNDGIEGVGNLASQSGPGARKAHGKIAIPHGLQASQNHAEIPASGLGNSDRIAIGFIVILACVESAVGNGRNRAPAIPFHRSSCNERQFGKVCLALSYPERA
jgi:hypothetical protein